MQGWPSEQLRRAVGDHLRQSLAATATVIDCVAIPGQASNRRYFRLRLAGTEAVETAILVVLPPDPLASDEAQSDGGPAELPFSSLRRYLEGIGLPVPRIYCDATSQGFMVQEDLGPVTLLAALAGAADEELEGRYRQAIDLLLRFQTATDLDRGAPPSIGHARRFGAELLRFELDHFKEWLLLDYAGLAPAAVEMAALDRELDEIVVRLSDQPYRLAHRDYQSTNLMVASRGLVIIDFQDALMAPPAYDLVSLLRDSYISLPPEMVARLVAYYLERAVAAGLVADPDSFVSHFHLQTIQRKLKDAGRFVFIDRTKGNPGFLKWIPASLGYAAWSLDRLGGFDQLRALVAQCCAAAATGSLQIGPQG